MTRKIFMKQKRVHQILNTTRPFNIFNGNVGTADADTIQCILLRIITHSGTDLHFCKLLMEYSDLTKVSNKMECSISHVMVTFRACKVNCRL